MKTARQKAVRRNTEEQIEWDRLLYIFIAETATAVTGQKLILERFQVSQNIYLYY